MPVLLPLSQPMPPRVGAERRVVDYYSIGPWPTSGDYVELYLLALGVGGRPRGKGP